MLFSKNTIPHHILQPSTTQEEVHTSIQKIAKDLGWSSISIDENILRFRPTRSMLSSSEIQLSFFEGRLHIEAKGKDKDMEEVAELWCKSVAERLLAMGICTVPDSAIEDGNSSMSKGDAKPMFDSIIPHKGNLITPVLIAINLLVYVAMVIAQVDPIFPTAEDLFDWGGNWHFALADGEYWRLLTAIFVHGGIIHLALNMYALLSLGHHLEEKLGAFNFVILYIAAGIGASTVSGVINENTVSVGASGAIFGIFGAYALLLLSERKKLLSSKNEATGIIGFLGYNLFYGFSKEGIDNSAHIGGLITGIILVAIYLIISKLLDNKKLTWIPGMAMLVLTGTSSATALSTTFGDYIPTYVNQEEIDKTIGRLQAMEANAMQVFESLPNEGPNAQAANDLENIGIYYWNETILVLDELNNMGLTEEANLKIRVMRSYCNLRIEQCEQLVLYFRTGNEANKAAAEEVLHRIEKMPL